MEAEMINQRKVKQFIQYNIETNPRETCFWFVVIIIGLPVFFSNLIGLDIVSPMLLGILILGHVQVYYVTTKKILTLKFAIVALILGMLLGILINTIAPYLTLLYLPVCWIIGELIQKFFK